MEEQSIMYFIQRVQLYELETFIRLQWNIANWILYLRNPFEFYRCWGSVTFGFHFIMVHISFVFTFPDKSPPYGMEIPVFPSEILPDELKTTAHDKPNPENKTG